MIDDAGTQTSCRVWSARAGGISSFSGFMTLVIACAGPASQSLPPLTRRKHRRVNEYPIGINPFRDQLSEPISRSARRIRKSVHSSEQQLLRELLVAARDRAGLTQQKLAKRLGTHQSFLAKSRAGTASRCGRVHRRCTRNWSRSTALDACACAEDRLILLR